MTTRTRIVILLLALAVLIVIMGPIFCQSLSRMTMLSSPSSPSPSPIDVSGTIGRVSDGDTINLDVMTVLDPREAESIREGDRVKVRLHGIDAPEIRQECVQYSQPFRCGVTATNILKGLIGDREVGCDLRTKDRYGRWVAVCYLGGTEKGGEGVRMGKGGEGVTEDISRLMVLSGYAVAYVKYSTDYVDAEDEAKRMRHGLWEDGVEWINPSDYRKEVKRRKKE